jgi:hypothetical protein
MARDTVQVLVNLKKTGTGAKEAEQELTGLDKAARVAGAALATFATRETVRAVYELGKFGAESLRTQASFEAISGSAMEAETRLEAMRRATRGAISDQQMMSAASRMMQMGLANNAAELETMAGMAVRLGAAMGKDAAGAIEEWNLLIANQSIPRLDTFGVSAARVRTRIKQLQAATKGMTREEAFMVAVMEEGEESLERLGETVDDEMLAFEQMEANIANLKAAFGEQLAPAIAEVTGWLAKGLEEINRQTRAMDEYEAILGRSAVGQAILNERFGGGVNAMDALAEMTARVTEASELSAGQMNDYAEMAGIATGATERFTAASDWAAMAQDGLATSARTVAGAFGELEFDDETLWKMAMASGASLDELGNLAQVLGIATDAEVQHTMEAYAMVEAFGAGQVSAGELSLSFDALGRSNHAAALAAADTSEETRVLGIEMIDTSGDADMLGASLIDTHDAFDETVRRASRLREALARLRAMAQGTKSALDNMADAMGDGGDRGRQAGGIAAGGMTLYGEGGPELGFLPRGTRVIPAWESRQVLRSMTDNRQWHRGGDTFVIQDPLTAAMLLEDRRRALERKLRANM